MDPTWWIDALLSPEGETLLEQLSAEPLAKEDQLRVLTRYRARHPAELVNAAISQVLLRRRARLKFTLADRMLFTQAGLEQASTERMARHHAERFAGAARLADLCTGIGGDLLALAAGREALAVDLDAVHLRLARHNAEVNGVGGGVRTALADVRDVSLDGIDAAFVDPARRTEARRLGPGASEPPLDWCLALPARVAAVGVKAAPALPTELVPADWELEFVSEDRELKEALLWSPALATGPRRATVLPGGETLVPTSGDGVAVAPPGAYLIDPDPAVTRAGLVEDLARVIGGCWKIDERVAFLSSDGPVETPFGRTLRVEASLPWSLARLRERLRELDVRTVDIRKRGSAVDVDEVQQRLKLTGTRGVTVVLTRVADRPWAFVCSATGS